MQRKTIMGRVCGGNTNRVDQTPEFCKKSSRNWELGGAAKWINTATAHEEATCVGSLDSKTSGIIFIVL